MADNLEQLYGDYAADADSQFAKTPLQGLSSMSDVTSFAAGCADNKCTNYSADSVIKALDDAQLIVICVGTGRLICGPYILWVGIHVDVLLSVLDGYMS